MDNLIRRNNPGKRRKRTIITSSAVVVIIIIVIQLLAPNLFPSLFTSIARPFWRVEFAIRNGSMRSNDELLRENADLERQVQDLQVQNESIQSIESENQELKSMFGRASTTPYILAAVLKHPPLAVYDELVIDAGRDQDLATSSLVYAPGDVLIGHISDVMSQTSKVTLFSSPGQQYQVMIGDSHSSATAIGRGGGQYEAQISRDITVKPGDYVNVPSLSDRVFGIVTTVLTDPTQAFETVLFAPPVNIYELKWVLVKS